MSFGLEAAGNDYTFSASDGLIFRPRCADCREPCNLVFAEGLGQRRHELVVALLLQCVALHFQRGVLCATVAAQECTAVRVAAHRGELHEALKRTGDE